MDWANIILKAVTVLARQNRKTIISVVFITLATIVINYNYINTCIFKKDIVEEYLKRGRAVELSLRKFKDNYNCDAVSIAILHNGTVSIADPQFHLMKFSILFSVGENARNTKSIYVNQPLSIWIDNFTEMLYNGYFLTKDASTDVDPLVRLVYKSSGMKTGLYLPMYKHNSLIGYAIVSWKNEKIVTANTIKFMKRSLMDTESKL